MTIAEQQAAAQQRMAEAAFTQAERDHRIAIESLSHATARYNETRYRLEELEQLHTC